MKAAGPGHWHEANQRYLTAALAEVRESLEGHASRGQALPELDGRCGPARQALQEAATAMPAPPALETLCAAVGLSPFERDLLLLCAGMELDAAFASLCAAAQGEPARTYPTFSLALAALRDPHWSALTPAAPLRRWRLVEVGTGNALVVSPLRIDERVLHYLAGASYLDERLHGLVAQLRLSSEPPPSHRVVVQRIVQLWSSREAWPRPVIQLCGSEQDGKRLIAASACAALGIELCVVGGADIPGAVAEREALARLWEREAILSGSALLLDCEDWSSSDSTGPVRSLLESVQGMFFVTGREPLPTRTRPAIRLDVPKLSATEQEALWCNALGPLSQTADGHVERLVTHFSLGVQGIHAAASEVLGCLSHPEEDELGRALWEACRVQARPRLDDLAQRIEVVASWEDLVLPEAQRQILRDIVVHVNQRSTVYETWGFAARGSRGLAISALFAGASGTGKTMAAEVLANELRLDVYRIDLSSVVSKYIGETEKNLRRVFDAAEAGGAVLLFDEADALFGKRSEVKDSHDRYANIEVSYLLQRMEAYRGLAILTTNMKNALDPAFLRRIRFVVHFPFPDVTQRAEIWRRIFPPSAPTDGLDIARLAQLSLAGGNIRNIALNAAFLAADGEEPVRMTHLLRAAHAEYAKLEKPLTEAEFRGWA